MSDPDDLDDADAGGASTAETHELKSTAFLLLLVCLACAFVLGLVIKHFKITFLHEAGAALLMGMGVGLALWAANTSGSVTEWVDFNEEIFFFLLLPPIIFESGFSLSTRDFFNNFGGICALAFGGTLISTAVIGLCVWIFGAIGLITYLPFLHSLVFGALVSATDPVTVLALFQELGVNIDLYSLVFGESVLNDAVAIVTYRALINFHQDGVSFVSLITAIAFFGYIFVGSVLVGTFFAVATTIFFKLIGGPLLASHTHIEASLVMIAPYCAYTAAESVSLSGIVAILFCGIVMAHYTRPNLSPESQKNTKEIFKTLATLAETFVFIYMGVAMFLENQAWKSIPFAIVALLACMGGRACNIFPLTKKINAWRSPGRQIPENHVHMLWICGLRGAIAFALASSTIRDLGVESGRVIRTATLMIIIFTVLTIGGACSYLVDRLDLKAPSVWNEMDDSPGGGGGGAGAEGGARGGVRGGAHGDSAPGSGRGSVHGGEVLMPEYNSSLMSKLGSSLREVGDNSDLDRMGKVRAAASAVAETARMTSFTEIDNRYIRPYLTVNTTGSSREPSRGGSPDNLAGGGGGGNGNGGGDLESGGRGGNGTAGGGDANAAWIGAGGASDGARDVVLEAPGGADAGAGPSTGTPLATIPQSPTAARADTTPLGLPSPMRPPEGG